MEISDVLTQADRIRNLILQDSNDGPYTQACEFLRVFAGSKSSFYTNAVDTRKYTRDFRATTTASIVDSFIEYVKAGLHGELSVKRQAQVDVISDFLGQAQELLEQEGIHPAAPVVLIGASLEEFLRAWVEDAALPLGGKKPGLDNYAKVLREAELITKQDIKDITAWAGIRNHAAHGQWSDVGERARVRLMLEGVNLFMRQYSRQPRS